MYALHTTNVATPRVASLKTVLASKSHQSVTLVHFSEQVERRLIHAFGRMGALAVPRLSVRAALSRPSSATTARHVKHSQLSADIAECSGALKVYQNDMTLDMKCVCLQ